MNLCLWLEVALLFMAITGAIYSNHKHYLSSSTTLQNLCELAPVGKGISRISMKKLKAIDHGLVT